MSKRIKSIEEAFLEESNRIEGEESNRIEGEESNRIEGILRPASSEEFAAFDSFMKIRNLDIHEIVALVQVFQPDAKLRTATHLNVVVGNYYPPAGGMGILYALEDLLNRINQGETGPYHAHHEYEKLHPFSDGNGRSGRMIWWKMMDGSNIGFLHRWYYQSLEYGRL